MVSNESWIDLGQFGRHDLSIRKTDLSALSDFTLFVDGATTAGSASASSSGGSRVQKTFNIITR
jgi:hypothetical protein